MKVRTNPNAVYESKEFVMSQYLYLLVKVRTLEDADLSGANLVDVAIPIPSGEGQNSDGSISVSEYLALSQYLYLLVKVRT